MASSSHVGPVFVGGSTGMPPLFQALTLLHAAFWLATTALWCSRTRSFLFASGSRPTASAFSALLPFTPSFPFPFAMASFCPLALREPCVSPRRISPHLPNVPSASWCQSFRFLRDAYSSRVR